MAEALRSLAPKLAFTPTYVGGSRRQQAAMVRGQPSVLHGSCETTPDQVRTQPRLAEAGGVPV